jgi:hypothetical protein
MQKIKKQNDRENPSRLVFVGYTHCKVKTGRSKESRHLGFDTGSVSNSLISHIEI